MAWSSWPAYLTTLAVRMAIDRLRRRQRWQRLLPTWRAGATGRPDSTDSMPYEPSAPASCATRWPA